MENPKVQQSVKVSPWPIKHLHSILVSDPCIDGQVETMMQEGIVHDIHN